GPIRNFLFDEPGAKKRDGIAFGFPELLFLFRTIVFAVDVTDMMSGKPVRAAQKELRSAACSRAVDQLLRRVVNSLYILAVDTDSRNAEAFGTREDVSRDGFGVVGVFVVEIVFANVDDGQLPQGSHVHDFVEKAL